MTLLERRKLLRGVLLTGDTETLSTTLGESWKSQLTSTLEDEGLLKGPEDKISFLKTIQDFNLAKENAVSGKGPCSYELVRKKLESSGRHRNYKFFPEDYTPFNSSLQYDILLTRVLCLEEKIKTLEKSRN